MDLVRRKPMYPRSHETAKEADDMRDLRHMTGFRASLMAAATALLLVVVAGACSSASAPSSSTSPGSAAGTTTASTTASTTAGTTAAVAAGCVRDATSVISSTRTAASLTAALPADLVAKLDQTASSEFEKAASPGAVVGVRTPQGTWLKAYGVADPSTKAPMSTDMFHRIASVTKTFTGTVLLQLAEDGMVSLDDPISTYVPNVPQGDRITLAMLANMTSGLASYSSNTAFTDAYFADPTRAYTPQELLAAGISQPSLFAPGTSFNYSNTNTVLLGLVIEKVTGKTFGEVLQQKILTPLKLTTTSWPNGTPAFPDPHAQGFTLRGPMASPSNPAKATSWNPSWGWTAGELISTPKDMLTWVDALATGQGLLTPKDQAERLRSLPGPAGYGLGFACANGWVGHTGDIPGYNTAAFYDTNSATSVIVTANSDIVSGNCPVSPTLTDDPRQGDCAAPATRIFVAVTTALGNTATLPGAK
jgi:D-alanyl-D-alanine carboxypeptidase